MKSTLCWLAKPSKLSTNKGAYDAAYEPPRWSLVNARTCQRGRLPADSRTWPHRRPPYYRTRGHRGDDRLVLLPAFRLPEPVRGTPRSGARRLLETRPDWHGLDDQAALLPGHQHLDHPLPEPPRRGRGSGLHAGRFIRSPAPPSDTTPVVRARPGDVPR